MILVLHQAHLLRHYIVLLIFCLVFKQKVFHNNIVFGNIKYWLYFKKKILSQPYNHKRKKTFYFFLEVNGFRQQKKSLLPWLFLIVFHFDNVSELFLNDVFAADVSLFQTSNLTFEEIQLPKKINGIKRLIISVLNLNCH